MGNSEREKESCHISVLGRKDCDPCDFHEFSIWALNSGGIITFNNSSQSSSLCVLMSVYEIMNKILFCLQLQCPCQRCLNLLMLTISDLGDCVSPDLCCSYHDSEFQSYGSCFALEDSPEKNLDFFLVCFFSA